MLAAPANLSEVAFKALETKQCTYVELGTILGLEDALNIIEFEEVAMYNRNKIEYLWKLENG